MRVAVVYVFPQVQTRKYYPLAARFAETWQRFPPGSEEHVLYVIGNGGEVPPLHRAPFVVIPGCEFRDYDNVGWDIGAFQWAAAKLPCDLLVCLGAPVHFHRAGWLDRMVDAWLNHGPALYGCWAYLSPNWHVRTTAFWLPPELLNSYPYAIGNLRASRYDFEHGPHSLTRHVLSAGMECLMVTTDGCYHFGDWADHAPGVDQSLVLDQHVHR